MKIKRSQAAFTLVELLVAIAIFAILSALGWKVFDYLGQTKARNSIHEEHLSQIQEAYQQIQRDMLQIIAVGANVDGSLKPALQLDNQLLSFSKTGVTDPLKQGLAPDERIEYQYNAEQKTIYRLKYTHLDRTAAEQPLSSVLLKNVEQYEITLLDPNELSRWPESVVNLNDNRASVKLPRGLKIKMSVNEVEYEWIFSLLNTSFISKTGP